MEFTSIQSTAAIPVGLHPGGLGYAILNPPSFAIPFDMTEAKPAQGHRQDEPIIRMYDQSAGGAIPTEADLSAERRVPKVTIAPSARSMLTDRMQETLNRLLALLTQEARRNFIPVSKIEIRGFVDPEEDTKEVVVTQWVKVPPSTALDYWDRLGAAVELWIDYLPETLASIVLERIAIKVGGMLMPDPLDPLASFHLAQELAERSDEVRLRTAIGRAYYALFLIAREKTGVRDRGRVHKNVIEAIKKRKGYLTTGEQLDSLRRLRTVADYELLPHNPDDGDWARNLVNSSSPR